MRIAANTHRVVTGNIFVGRTVHGEFKTIEEAKALQATVPDSITESYQKYDNGGTSPIVSVER